MTETKPQRIALLDIVRGLAVLGILLMNIRLFSEPYAAYFNPKAYGSYEGLNALWFHFQFLFADQKFMAIFSMLFGASTAIICDGLVRRGDPVAYTFAKRNFGLLLIGAAHAYLLWHGDILVPYAICSFAPFLMRNVRWQLVAATGLALLLIGTALSYGGYQSLSAAPEHIQQAMAAEMWQPTGAAIAVEVATFQSGWLDQLALRAALALSFETDTFAAWGFWRISGLMLLGLSLYRSGFLKGQLSAKGYGVAAILCLIVGFSLVNNGLQANINADWAFPYSMLKATIWNYWGSFITAIGYMSLIGFLLTATSFRFGFHTLSNVGKAALSNYLFQTVACTLIFYGHGFGLFGTLERYEAAFVVVGVWTTQMILSNWWFKSHSKGPLEDLWHRVTYARWLPAK